MTPKRYKALRRDRSFGKKTWRMRMRSLTVAVMDVEEERDRST
jgi:hypothetical protein